MTACATGRRSASSLRSTAPQPVTINTVTLSCWFCKSEGVEYSFLPEVGGRLTIAKKEAGKEDFGTMQAFDTDRTIILCSVRGFCLFSTGDIPLTFQRRYTQSHHSQITDMTGIMRRTEPQRPVRFEIFGSSTNSRRGSHKHVRYSCLLLGSIVPVERQQRSR